MTKQLTPLRRKDRATGYQAAVKDIVAWLRIEQNTCDCSAHCANECACGAWDEWKTVAIEPVIDRLEAEFGDKP